MDLLPYTLELQKQIIEELQVACPFPTCGSGDDDVLGYCAGRRCWPVEIGDLPAGAYVVTTTDERVRVVAEALAALLPVGP